MNRKGKNEAVRVLEQTREEDFGIKTMMQAVSEDTSYRILQGTKKDLLQDQGRPRSASTHLEPGSRHKIGTRLKHHGRGEAWDTFARQI